MKILHLVILVVGLSCVSALEGYVWGKIDFDPAYIHLDVLEHNKTTKRLDMPAFKTGGNFVINNSGWCIKPMLLYGSNDGEIFNGSLGVGHCFPIMEGLIVTPTVGVGYTYFRSTIDIPIAEVGTFKFREKFYSTAPYVGVEITKQVNAHLRLCGQFQYGWSRTRTTLRNRTLQQKLRHTSNAGGSSYAFLAEYDLNQCWSVHAGAAYNISLTKEKHGLRAYGGTIGIARWF